jgi:hypothetical protein
MLLADMDSHSSRLPMCCSWQYALFGPKNYCATSHSGLITIILKLESNVAGFASHAKGCASDTHCYFRHVLFWLVAARNTVNNSVRIPKVRLVTK